MYGHKRMNARNLNVSVPGGGGGVTDSKEGAPLNGEQYLYFI